MSLPVNAVMLVGGLLLAGISYAEAGQATVLDVNSRWEAPVRLVEVSAPTEGLRVELVDAASTERGELRAPVVLTMLDDRVCYWPELVVQDLSVPNSPPTRTDLEVSHLRPRATSGVAWVPLWTTANDGHWAVHGECHPQTIEIHGGRGGKQLGLNKPRGLALLPQGQLFVADKGNNRVVRIGAAGQLISAWSRPLGEQTDFSHPMDLAFDAQHGELYVCDTNNQRIAVLDSQGKLRRTLPTADQEPLEHPTDIALSPDGHVLYVLDAALPTIVVLSTAGTRIDTWGGFAEGPLRLSTPLDIETDPSGRVYVSDGATGVVHVLSASGAILRAIGQPGEPGVSFRYPAAVVPLQDGRLLIADFAADRIRLLDPEGAQLSWFGIPTEAIGGVNYPSDAKLSGTRLYVSEAATDTVSVFEIGSWLSRSTGRVVKPAALR